MSSKYDTKSKRFKLTKVDDYHYNDGTFIDGTRVVLISNTHLNEIDPKYIGQSGDIAERWCEHGAVLYDVKFNDGVLHIVPEDYVEIDKSYYREEKINGVLNEEI